MGWWAPSLASYPQRLWEVQCEILNIFQQSKCKKIHLKIAHSWHSYVNNWDKSNKVNQISGWMVKKNQNMGETLGKYVEILGK